MTQPDLFAKSRAEEIQARFLTFHAENPEVWRRFVEVTKRAIGRGYEHWGAAAAFEVIRWETPLHTDGSAFKLSNDFCALYARAFNHTYPEHGQFFRLRYLRSADAVATGGGDYTDARPPANEGALNSVLLWNFQRINEKRRAA